MNQHVIVLIVYFNLNASYQAADMLYRITHVMLIIVDTMHESVRTVNVTVLFAIIFHVHTMKITIATQPQNIII